MSDKINEYHTRGAIGIISARRKDYRRPGDKIWGTVGLNFKLPVGNVNKEAIDHAKSLGNKTVTIIFYGYDHNEWEATEDGDGYILFSFFTAGMFFFNVCLAGYRLVQWMYRKGGIDKNIGFLCLFLEFINNLLRVIQICFWGLHNNFNIIHMDILYTIPWCITDLTTIIIVFFWLDLAVDPLYHGKFMGMMRVPAGILFLMIVIAEIALDVVRVYGTTDYTEYVVICYGTCLLVVVLANFGAIFMILKPFDKSHETKKKVRRIIYRILGSGLASIFGVGIFFGFINVENQYTPAGKTSMWFFLYFFFFLQSLLLIMIFKVPKKSAISSSNKNTKDTKENTSSNKETKEETE